MAVRTKAAESLLREARMNRMTPKLERIAALKDQIEAASAELDALTEEVMDPMIAVGKTYTVNGVTYTAVTPERAYYDDAAIRQEVGESIWVKIRKESIDSKALAAVILAGEVKAEQIAEFTEFKPTKKYILVTRQHGTPGGQTPTE